MALISRSRAGIAEGAGSCRTTVDGLVADLDAGRRITGKRLGIVGMGRIGRRSRAARRAFGLSIHYHNRPPVGRGRGELEATYWDSLDQMLARMDIVSVNCPHTPATYHLLSARRLKLMRPDAIVVNTARGEIIDENALAA
jgi:glyoxylate reductase